ncbi:sporulation-specific protein 15-like [Iris pallida]|uniref:Sporulation-specific protein 15-like n=1 Tax=Iris pallida TaxID=29817 RepID=A0AAX6GMH6_IRIPA|nr:sporulation-specific protein 15-like [Iris pallida]
MKKKHRLEKFFSSVVGTHVDNENSDALPNKEDVENDVERILKILRTEESGQISSENSFDRSELASRLENFHQGYQVVHGRYNHLVGKIAKKFCPKGSGNGNFSIDSSSSDSESSESGLEEFSYNKSRRSREKKADQIPTADYYTLQQQLESANIKNTELETMATIMRTKLEEGQTSTAELVEREASIITLQNELQTMSDSVQVLQAARNALGIEIATLLEKGDYTNQRIIDLQEENETLRSETAEAFSRIHEMEASIEKSEVELDEIKDETQRVHFENKGLKEELEMTIKEVAKLAKQLTASNEEKEALRSGNFVFLRRIQEAEKALADFRDQADQKLKLATEEVTSWNESLSSENENLKFRLEAADQQSSDMTQRVSTAVDEISSLKSDILRSSNQTQEAEKTIEVMTTDLGNLKDENLKLLNMNNDLNQQLRVKDVEKEALASEYLEYVEAARQAEENTSVLSKEIEKVKDEKSQLLVNYENLKLQLEATNQKLRVKEVENEALASEYLEAVEAAQQAEEKTSVLSKEIEMVKDENSHQLVNCENMKRELEGTNQKFSELKLILEAAQNENQSVVTENSELRNKIQQAEKVIDDFRAETDLLGTDKSEMQIKVNDLSLQLHTANLESTNLKKAVEVAEKETKILTLQSSEVLSKFLQADINMKQLQEELEILREDNSLMQQNQIKLEEAETVIVDLKAEIEHLRADNSQLKTNVTDQDLELEASTLQLSDLVTKLEQLQEEKFMLEHNHSDMQSQKLDMEVRLDDKLSEILSLKVEHEALQERTTNQIKALIAQVDDVQRERHLLNNQKKELEEDIRSLTCRSLEEQEMIKNLQVELKDRICSEEVTVKGLKDSSDELLSNYKKLESCFQESCEKLECAEKKAEELGRKEETIQTLGAVNEKKQKEMVKFEETHKELLEKLEFIESEKADADRKTAKLHKHVQSLEVQIRLSNQKLKITETENKEKEEGYKIAMEALGEERSELEGKLVRLSGKLDVLEKELRQLKELAEVDISALANGFHELETVFDSNNGYMQIQLSAFINELKMLKNWLAQLKNEKQELSVRLKYKEGIMSMMRDEAESIEDKLAKTEKELAILRTKEDESEKRIKALEEMLREKKKEVSDKDEAKKEAIRQLCLLIEYHRENCAYLSQYLTTLLKRSARSS